MGHPWESTGERRTVVWGQGQPEEVMRYLNGWPYRMYQSMVKPPNRTKYVSPRGTSSKCPVCGGKLEHPVWAVSRCVKCGVDYGRDRLASLAILCRDLRLCGQPFAVSADASWKALRDEYLYTDGTPGAIGAGLTEPSSAPNSGVYAKIHV
jgi:transposase